MKKLTKPHSPDFILLGAAIILVIFGLVMLSSASMVKSQEKFNQPYYYLYHQLLYGGLIALLTGFIFYKVNYKTWRKYSFFIYLATIAGLLLVFIPGIGITTGGAVRWLSLGPITIQPSEFAKLALIIYLAALLENKTEKSKSDKDRFLTFLIVTGIIIVLVVFQPNVGTAGLIGLIATTMYFASGRRLREIILILVGGAVLFLFLIKIYPHAGERFQVFLHPELDPQNKGYQINQALLAIGSGGLFGRGLGQSIQKYNYLPEPIGDSIFAIISEELGFFGSTSVISLFLVLAFRGFKIARKAPDQSARLMALGIVYWLVLQAFINIASISGLIPLTGVPLPFISYGGSALIASVAGIALLLNISKYTIGL